MWPYSVFLSALFAPFDASARDTPVLRAVDEGKLPSLERALSWINTPPLSAADLRGKVVLVDFWTYTCINWRRTLPYLRVWAEKYRDQGLVIVGVHTPEFSFERDLENVRRAARDQHVDYPIAIDSDYTIWEAFDNQYWPALYFIDARGRIRHHQFGEGDYDKLEAVIQRLLVEAGRSSVSLPPSAVQGLGAEAIADWEHMRSPETYLGFERSTHFVSSGSGGVPGRSRRYAAPRQAQAKPVGTDGRLDHAPGVLRAQRARRPTDLSISRARRAPGHGAGRARQRDSFSRVDRRRTASGCTWCGH